MIYLYDIAVPDVKAALPLPTLVAAWLTTGHPLARGIQGFFAACRSDFFFFIAS